MDALLRYFKQVSPPLQHPSVSSFIFSSYNCRDGYFKVSKEEPIWSAMDALLRYFKQVNPCLPLIPPALNACRTEGSAIRIQKLVELY